MEIIQTAQSGVVHSNESIVELLKENNKLIAASSNQDIVGLLKQNNEILENGFNHLAVDMGKDNTPIINNAVVSNVVKTDSSTADIGSFREQVKNTIYR